MPTSHFLLLLYTHLNHNHTRWSYHNPKVNYQIGECWPYHVKSRCLGFDWMSPLLISDPNLHCWHHQSLAHKSQIPTPTTPLKAMQNWKKNIPTFCYLLRCNGHLSDLCAWMRKCNYSGYYLSAPSKKLCCVSYTQSTVHHPYAISQYHSFNTNLRQQSSNSLQPVCQPWPRRWQWRRDHSTTCMLKSQGYQSCKCSHQDNYLTQQSQVREVWRFNGCASSFYCKASYRCCRWALLQGSVCHQTSQPHCKLQELKAAEPQERQGTCKDSGIKCR